MFAFAFRHRHGSLYRQVQVQRPKREAEGSSAVAIVGELRFRRVVAVFSDLKQSRRKIKKQFDLLFEADDAPNG